MEFIFCSSLPLVDCEEILAEFMQMFRYQARMVSGEVIDGLISAPTLEEAKVQLSANGKVLLLLEALGQGGASVTGEAEAIIFGEIASADVPTSMDRGMGLEMKEYVKRVEQLIRNKADFMEEATVQQLKLHQKKTAYLFEHPSERVWQRQRAVLDKLFRLADKEIERNEIKRWEEWGEGDGEEGGRRETRDERGERGSFVERWKRARQQKAHPIRAKYTEEQEILDGHGPPQSRKAGQLPLERGSTCYDSDLSDEVMESGGVQFDPEEGSSIQKIRYWYRVINHPRADREREVLAKARYEAVWLELQRFIGALLTFYLATYFVAYVLIQRGMTEVFLVRIFSTTLFKQLVIFLFVLYGLLTLRRHFLRNHLMVDTMLFLVWLGVLLVLVRG